MKFRNLFYYLLPFFLISCFEKEKKEEVVKKTHIETSKNKDKFVVFTGVSDDSIALNYVNISDASYFAAMHHKDSEKEIINDTLYLKLKSIQKPQLMEIMTSSESNFYKGKIYVKPGDSINFEIKNKKIIFTGKNSAENNLYTELYSSTPFYYENNYKGDIKSYKDSIVLLYNKKKRFLSKYISNHNNISNEFIDIVNLDLKHEYLYEIMNPRTKRHQDFNMYYSSSNELKNIIIKEVSDKEMFFNFNDYFEDLSIEDFNQKGLIENTFFKDNINTYIRNYFDDSENADYSKGKLLAEKEFIEKNLDGELKDYAIARMIRDYNKMGFGHDIENNEFMKNLVEKYEGKFKEASYNEKMIEIREDLTTYNSKLSDFVINTKFLNFAGDTITLKQVFDNSKGQIKVIDIWASWCPPCITDIKETRKFKNKISKEKNVKWIYLSIDEDKDDWIQMSNKLDGFFNIQEQYFALDGKNSPLAKSLKVTSIPRYVILNGEYSILVNNSPSPLEERAFEDIIDNILK